MCVGSSVADLDVLGRPDPDPLVRYGTGSFYTNQNSKKIHVSYCFVIFYDFLYLKNDVKECSFKINLLLPS
jgi:hypothetical protein